MPDRLRAQDARFLAAERAVSPSQVATLAILEPGPGGFDSEHLLRAISDRIPLVPRYRQRVLRLPAGLARPRWVDDEAFDLSFHVRRAALPSPGSMAQLRDLVARLVARPLDSTRPLWEACLVEGLAQDRVALLIKSHQALVDGTDTVDLAQLLLEESPEPREIPGADWTPQPAPSAMGELARSATHTLRRPTRLPAVVGAAVGSALGSGASAVGSLLPVGGGRGTASGALSSATPAQQRRYATLATPLADYRRVQDAFGGTVNDVILAVIAGGLRSWLLTRAEPVDASRSLRALVPMTVLNADGEPTSLGVQVRGRLLTLPVGESSPLVRLHQVSYALRAHQETGRAVSANRLAALPGFAPTTFHALGARVADGLADQSYDLVVTNAPGPQEPLYVQDAKLTASYPVLPLRGGRAVAIGVTSYDGQVYVGITADRDAVPDADVLAQCLEEALEELVEATPAEPSSTRAPRGRTRLEPDAPSAAP